MQAQYLTIESKRRPMIGLHASMADFRCSDGDAVSAAIVATSPHLSLYCLDKIISLGSKKGWFSTSQAILRATWYERSTTSAGTETPMYRGIQ